MALVREPVGLLPKRLRRIKARLHRRGSAAGSCGRACRLHVVLEVAPGDLTLHRCSGHRRSRANVATITASVLNRREFCW